MNIHPAPIAPGYYWAKMLKVDPGTRDGKDAIDGGWEVVNVFEDTLDVMDREHLAVFVPGIETSQSLDNFEWGARVEMNAPRQNVDYGMPAEITTNDLRLPAKRVSINQWIDEQFLGAGIAHRRKDEPAWAGEPFCSIESAKDIARGAALQVIADQATLIDNLVKLCHGRNVKAGWWTDLATGEDLHGKRNVGELLMLCVSELAEAMEGHRKNLMDDKLPQYPMITVELADCIIRIFDLAGALNLDLGQAFVDKLEFNRTREDHRPENRMQDGGKRY